MSLRKGLALIKQIAFFLFLIPARASPTPPFSTLPPLRSRAGAGTAGTRRVRVSVCLWDAGCVCVTGEKAGCVQRYCVLSSARPHVGVSVALCVWNGAVREVAQVISSVSKDPDCL